MRQVISLIWKETREHRWLFIASAAIFWGITQGMLVVQSYSEYYRENDQHWGEAMAVKCGWMLAIILATAATSRDLRKNVHNFWASRPIGTTRLFLAKYFHGIVVLLVVTSGALFLQMIENVQLYQKLGWNWSYQNSYSAQLLLLHSFTLVLVYSVSFLLGCLVRRASHEALLSVIAVLLIYFLPMVFPPLGKLSILNLTRVKCFPDPTQWLRWNLTTKYPFMITMALASGLSVVLGIIAVQHNWRIKVNKRLLSWLIVGVGAILLCSAAFQLSDNLTCEAKLPLGSELDKNKYIVRDIILAGDRGAMLLEDNQDGIQGWGIRKFDISTGQVQLGPEQLTKLNKSKDYWYDAKLALSPEKPQLAYALRTGSHRKDRKRKKWALYTVKLDANEDNAVVHKLDLLSHLKPDDYPTNMIHPRKDKLYVRSTEKLLVIDIQIPEKPRVSQTFDIPPNAYTRLKLLPLDNLSLRDRLEMTVKMLATMHPTALNDDLLVVASRDNLTTYRLTGFEGDIARFEQLGKYYSTPIQSFGASQPAQILLRDKLVFVLSMSGRRVTAYDLSDPAQPRRVGYYTAPNEDFFSLAPLPNGRTMVVGTSNLHILAPPGKYKP